MNPRPHSPDCLIRPVGAPAASCSLPHASSRVLFPGDLRVTHVSALQACAVLTLPQLWNWLCAESPASFPWAGAGSQLGGGRVPWLPRSLVAQSQAHTIGSVAKT